MVEMLARPPGVHNIPPLPPRVRARDIALDCLPILDPPRRMSVTDAAEAFVRLPHAGNFTAFDRAVAPYMVEPADMTQSLRYSAEIFMGPAQSAKTTMLQSVVAYSVACDPSPVHVVHMSQTDANAWVEEKLNPMIAGSPALRERLGLGRDDDTFSRKRFRGMVLTIGYPVASQLSGRSQKMVLLTDYDRQRQMLGGKDNPEGSPYKLAEQRIKSYLSAGLVLVESSPAFPVLDRAWVRPAGAPHMMPPVAAGIAGLYNDGTRGRLYWECRECAGEFEAAFENLHFDETLAPGPAGASAVLACPHCGGVYEPRHKAELSRAILKGAGGWRHETEAGDLVAIEDAAVRATPVLSYALDGVAAVFTSWARLVSGYVAAKQKADLGDDSDLRGWTYTDLGRPYMPPKNEDADFLNVEDLTARAVPLARGVAPAWVRLVTISVDVQAASFPVAAIGWGEGGRAVVLDRFDIVRPPEGAPNTDEARKLDPAKYEADWAVLEDLETRAFEIQGMGHALTPCSLAVDFHGAPGVSDNAEKFWRRRRRAGRKIWRLSRGRGGFDQRQRAWLDKPERASKGKRARSIELLNMATDRLKNSVAAMLNREEGDGASLLIGDWMPADRIAEFCAEEKGAKGWEKRPGQLRNESLDLAVQGLAQVEVKGLTKIDWARPPDFAREGPANPFSVPLPQASRALDVAGSAVEAPPAPEAPPDLPAALKPRARPRRLF